MIAADGAKALSLIATMRHLVSSQHTQRPQLVVSLRVGVGVGRRDGIELELWHRGPRQPRTEDFDQSLLAQLFRLESPLKDSEIDIHSFQQLEHQTCWIPHAV